MIVDDSGGKIDRDLLQKRRPNWIIVNDAFQHKYMGTSAWIIPKRNPSCKNFGLYYAWKEGFDTVILLDDDCDTRITPDFLESIPVGRKIELPQFVTENGWVNPLFAMMYSRQLLYSRGYPYELRADQPLITIDYDLQPVVSKFNEGLWSGFPDINGVDKLEMDFGDFQYIRGGSPPKFPPWYIPKEIRPDPSNLYLTRGQKLPLSIMNVQLHRDLIPAFYQPPDFELYGNFRVRRHDDVWSMYVLKKLMDKMGDFATVGEPVIFHNNPTNALKETVHEHVTNLIQPILFEEIDYSMDYIKGESYAEMAYSLGKVMMTHYGHDAGVFGNIIKSYGSYVAAWANLFL
jgi:hypothetical protein